MKKTDDLLKELSTADNINDFLNGNENNFIDISISAYLNKLLTEKNLKKSDVIKKSELSEIYAYQVFSGTKINPNRDKLICLAFGMGLNVAETQQMLKSCGLPFLYAKHKRDSIILFSLGRGLSVVEANELLYNSDEATLG
ncbi:MAG: hypothetical protein J6B75_09645 [Ruminococcus sp.]|nr:hypothetical protein [Ruminococcus sp.]